MAVAVAGGGHESQKKRTQNRLSAGLKLKLKCIQPRSPFFSLFEICNSEFKMRNPAWDFWIEKKEKREEKTHFAINWSGLFGPLCLAIKIQRQIGGANASLDHSLDRVLYKAGSVYFRFSLSFYHKQYFFTLVRRIRIPGSPIVTVRRRVLDKKRYKIGEESERERERSKSFLLWPFLWELKKKTAIFQRDLAKRSKLGGAVKCKCKKEKDRERRGGTAFNFSEWVSASMQAPPPPAMFWDYKRE